ncbi:MAG TPA: transcription antitermination factor NusB [Burkholderiaceae bacterium]|nr:transcription antitermination factor NusB [Burkholderiaceae bacterium]
MDDEATGAAEPRRGGGPRPPSRSARRRARELATQGLYQWLLSHEDSGVIEAHISQSPAFDKADREHFGQLLHGSIRDIDALHAALAPHLDRRIDELSPVEHATLLLGCYELMRHLEIPYRVVINEAVELAKTFGGTDGYKYVNGVLDRVAARVRPNEARARGAPPARGG